MRNGKTWIFFFWNLHFHMCRQIEREIQIDKLHFATFILHLMGQAWNLHQTHNSQCYHSHHMMRMRVCWRFHVRAHRHNRADCLQWQVNATDWHQTWLKPNTKHGLRFVCVAKCLGTETTTFQKIGSIKWSKDWHFRSCKLMMSFIQNESINHLTWIEVPFVYALIIRWKKNFFFIIFFEKNHFFYHLKKIIFVIIFFYLFFRKKNIFFKHEIKTKLGLCEMFHRLLIWQINS